MAREFRVDFNEIDNPQTITQVNIKKFKEQGLDIHTHEVETHDGIIDDHDKKQRVYRVKNTKYFGPWSKRS